MNISCSTVQYKEFLSAQYEGKMSRFYSRGNGMNIVLPQENEEFCHNTFHCSQSTPHVPIPLGESLILFEGSWLKDLLNNSRSEGFYHSS
jgi:hypothetical protein